MALTSSLYTLSSASSILAKLMFKSNFEVGKQIPLWLYDSFLREISA